MSRENKPSPDPLSQSLQNTGTGEYTGKTPRISGRRKKKIKHSDGGYGSHSSTTERKLNKFQEHEEAIIKDHSFSNECYLTALILSVFLMFGLIALNIYAYTKPSKSDQINESFPFALQSTRKTLAIASENIDCSILVKRRFYEAERQRNYMNVMAMLTCLHVTEPHSVAPDSALSMMFHSNNGRIELLEYNHRSQTAESRKNLNANHCALGKESNAKCLLNSIPNMLNGYVYLDDEITKSDLSSQMFQGGYGHYSLRYSSMFRKIFNSDFAVKEKKKMYREPAAWNEYKKKMEWKHFIKAEARAPEFPVSPLFAKLSENKTAPPHIKELTKKSRVSKGMVLKMSADVAIYLLEHFLRVRKKERAVTQRGFQSLALDDRNSDEEISRTKFVSLPKGATLSVVSAFIVKVVHDSMLTMQFKGKTTEERDAAKESTMYILIALSHRLAIDLLPGCKEWTGFNPKKSLLHRTDEFVEIIRRSDISELSKILAKYSKDKKVRRSAWDRVSSFIIWENFSGDSNLINMFSLSLPRLFGSAHYNKKRKEHARFTNGDDISQPFMSSAGLFISEREFQDTTDENVIFAATSSGTVRTVDAVVIPILRMLLFNEEPGKAVSAPAVYYDPRKGIFFCESKNTISHPTFADHSKRIRQALKSNGISCFTPRKDNFASVDRAGFAMSRKNLAMADIVAAVDPRSLDRNNYPVGH